MRSYQRFFSLLLACLFCLGALAACNGKTPAPEPGGTSGTTSLPGTDTVPGSDTVPPADEGPVISDAAKGITIATEEMLADWDAMLEAKRREILSTPNMDVSGFKKVYYVSPSGDDSNDGLSPETAWKTVDKVNAKYMSKDSCVCFERGGIYRGNITAKFGVTYTAYGEGPKPEIWGSPFNGAEVGTWEEVAPNIWRYSEKFANDVGLIVMNGGEEVGIKIILDYRQNPPTEFRDGGPLGPVWEGYTSLNENYEFWHDLGGARVDNKENPGYVYLYCDKGNPADLWDSIEFNVRGSVFVVETDYVTIDNLSIKYCGSSGISGGGFNLKNLTVTGCEIGWIGGALQTYQMGGRPVRYGNGCDIYGGCTDFTVSDCWVYQCYDAGLSWQMAGEQIGVALTMVNVNFTDNLIEKCNYNIEYFLAARHPNDDPSLDRYMKDIYITGNILADACYGWGEQRPDVSNGAHIKGWTHWNNREGEFIVSDNVFLRARYMMLDIGANDGEDLPDFQNNVFVQTDGRQWGNCCPNGEREGLGRLPYSYEAVSNPRYEGNEFYVIPASE